MPDYLPENLKTSKIETLFAKKTYGKSYDGLVITPGFPDNKAGMCFDLHSLYDTLDGEDELPKAYSAVANMVMANVSNIPVSLGHMVEDYDFLKEHLAIHLTNMNNWDDEFDEIPHRIYDDMIMYYRLEFQQPNGEMFSAVVSRKLMESFGIDEDELYRDAISNSQYKWPMEIKELDESDRKMFLVSSKNPFIGAGCIFYLDFVREAGEFAGGDFYVLPFSTATACIIKDNGHIPHDVLNKIAFDMYAFEPERDMRLTKKVYHCSLSDGFVKRVGEYVN